LLWLQGKTAISWRSQLNTEQAAWLVQDMAERMRANRGQLDAYRLNWGQAPNSVECNNRPCALVEWAWDRSVGMDPRSAKPHARRTNPDLAFAIRSATHRHCIGLARP
jgi:hypothetical protein